LASTDRAGEVLKSPSTAPDSAPPASKSAVFSGDSPGVRIPLPPLHVNATGHGRIAVARAVWATNLISIRSVA
jgi:hypothetical protein